MATDDYRSVYDFTPEELRHMVATSTDPAVKAAWVVGREQGRQDIREDREAALADFYVTRHDGDSVIWVKGTPAHPTRPDPMLTRTRGNAVLFDALAALLPDRTLEV